LRLIPPGQCGSRCGFGIWLACLLTLAMLGATPGRCQSPRASESSPLSHDPSQLSANGPKAQDKPQQVAGPLVTGQKSLAQWQGLPVRRISFSGVSAERLAPLKGKLAQAEGSRLNRENLASSLRQLFATGLFDSIEVEGEREADGVTIIFRGTPRTFIGVVTVDGAKGATVNTQLQRASRLTPGTRFTESKMTRALDDMRLALAQNGFNESAITYSLKPHPDQQLVDIAFQVVSGPQARVGTVAVTGDSGMSLEEFRRHAHLKTGALVDHETANRALSGVLKVYRGQKRLEAEIKLESQTYAAKKTNFQFSANKGPVVKVLVEGAPLEFDRVKRLIPVFEEGSVDDDLLNEGNRRLRDYYQSLGYFEVKVDHQQQSAQPGLVVIAYTVQLGTRRRVARVSVDGNHYFDSATLEELLSVHAANVLDRNGVYSQALVSADVEALQSAYQNNGFSKAKITPETGLTQTAQAGTPQSGSQTNTGQRRKPAGLTVVYHIEEGEQQRVGSVKLDGNEHVDRERLLPLMNTVSGQLLSPRNLAGDRDALVTEYMSRGFDQARVVVDEHNDPDDPNKVDVAFHISEGQQIFVRNVVLTGLQYTRQDTVARAITLHPGDPLNESALLETQRNLYEFALFNEINATVENPNGGETYKTILLQAVEARRWTLTYGAGFEAQTGTPQNNCRGYIASGVACSPNGHTGVSPRVVLNVTRNNLFGREQSASIQGTYGLLEQKIDFIFQNPHFHGNKNFGLTFTGGYANSQDVTTYVASKLDAGLRWTQTFNTPGSGLSRANTFIYEFDFRRVKVAEDSLQVFPSEVNLLATAVRVGGPGFTWIRDTRDSPIDAHRGTYTSFQEFLSASQFGAQAVFNRTDVSNSSFHGFDKNRFVLARNTRYGQERAFGAGSGELIPLPERLYSGGATSLRGFSINAAGPRDPDTGYPIGGAGALVNSTELRLPPPTLPYFGNTISLVVFHDMGNVFTNAGDAWPSALRFHQPDRDVCRVLTPADTSTNPPTEPLPNGPNTSTGQQGKCSFAYFSHTPGVGLRYHTPVGPIRLDFSYNLNPPIFPVNVNYSQSDPTLNQHVGEASHFNFFFSLGQTF
jgi:outer membrane protein insertion porin family